VWNTDNRCSVLHDNARSHTDARTRALLGHFNWELSDHPPYSPNLAPTDYHLFTHTYLKNWLRSQRFKNNELMEGVKTWLSSQAEDFLTQAYENLFPDTNASISAVDYVEK
jgi:histone-lysine N-methyltransferase SETMAR